MAAVNASVASSFTAGAPGSIGTFLANHDKFTGRRLMDQLRGDDAAALTLATKAVELDAERFYVTEKGITLVTRKMLSALTLPACSSSPESQGPRELKPDDFAATASSVRPSVSHRSASRPAGSGRHSRPAVS